MARKRKPLIDQLREAVLSADISRYRIAKETGITQAALSHFVNGLRGLSMESIDKLGAYLGLRIVADGKHHKRKG